MKEWNANSRKLNPSRNSRSHKWHNTATTDFACSLNKCTDFERKPWVTQSRRHSCILLSPATFCLKGQTVVHNAKHITCDWSIDCCKRLRSMLFAFTSLLTCSRYLLIINSSADWCSSSDWRSSWFSCWSSRILLFSCFKNDSRRLHIGKFAGKQTDPPPSEYCGYWLTTSDKQMKSGR